MHFPSILNRCPISATVQCLAYYSTRKELKIRPGFTPQEDIGRFRSNRQAAVDAVKGVVPGANRKPAKQSNPENPFAQEAQQKSKAQLKNEKRREKKRLESSNRDWDESSDDEQAGTAAPPDMSSEAAFPPLFDDASAGHGVPEGPDLLDEEAEKIPSSLPADGGVEPAQSTLVALDPPPEAPGEINDLAQHSSSTAPKQSTNTASASKPKRHPIQGGRDGPLGLAHPPPIETEKSWRKEKPSQLKNGTAKPASGKQTTKTAPQTKAAEPRVRKEVKIREGGANDMSSLANRVRNLVLENTRAPSPKENKSTGNTPPASGTA